jgi:hypothetical protein
MNAPLENRGLMAGLEEFEKYLLRSGVTTQSEYDPIAKPVRLLAQQEDSRDSLVEPRGPHPLRARGRGEDSWNPDILDELEVLLRADCTAIETEAKDARPRTTNAAASNAHANSTDELKAPRHKAKAVVSDPLGVAYRATSRRSLYVMTGIVMVGLAGLGAGIAFWNNASNPPDASSIDADAGLAKPPSQVATGADIPAQQASILDSSVSPPPATSGGDAEQLVDASRQQAETPPAVARQGETGLANQPVGAPASPIATQMPAEPVGIAALPEPRKAETASAAPLDAALRPSVVPAQATAAPPLPPRTPAAAAPASTPKTAPPARKAPKPTVAAKLGDPRQPGRIAKPAKAMAAEKVAHPDSTQPPITQTEALAPKPAAAPESSGAFTYIQRLFISN